MRWQPVAVGAVLVVGVVGVSLASHVVLVPSCTDQRTTELVRVILGDQFHVPGKLSLSNIRVVSGWWLGRRWECAAELDGIEGPNSIAGVRFNQVVYASEVTADTGRLYVTARIMASR